MFDVKRRQKLVGPPRILARSLEGMARYGLGFGY